MLYPSLANLLEKVNSRYMLVNVIAQKARVIAQKAEDDGEPLDEKPVSLAVREVAAGNVSVSSREHDSQAV